MKRFGSLALLVSLGLFAAGCGHHDFPGERTAHDAVRVDEHGAHVVVEPARVVVPATTIEVQNDRHPVALPIARRETIDTHELGAEAREDAADAAGLAAKDAAEQLLHAR